MTYEKPKTREIKGLTFNLTCGESPEQYDVMRGDTQLAYVRLRHGWLYVSDPSMDDVWWQIDDMDDAEVKLQGDGTFETATEREYFLNKIADVVVERGAL